MIYEDDVIEAVCEFLKSEGYDIESRATVRQHGEDIIAVKDGQRIVVEAKGAGSSKSHTKRYGKTFTRGQVFDHVAKAVLKALRVASADEGYPAVALPDNEDHRREIEQAQPALRRCGVGVFWVSGDNEERRPEFDGPWDL